VKNKNIYAWRKQAIVREIATHDFYCCLLPRCDALRICRSGFPIATVRTPVLYSSDNMSAYDLFLEELLYVIVVVFHLINNQSLQ